MRTEELIVSCVWCLWHCTDTVQSGRTVPIFGMHVVAVGSSESLVFTDGQLRLRSRSGYGFEIPRSRMVVGATFSSPRAQMFSYSTDDPKFFPRVKRTGRDAENSPPSKR